MVFWDMMPCSLVEKYLSTKIHEIISQKNGLLMATLQLLNACEEFYDLYMHAACNVGLFFLDYLQDTSPPPPYSSFPPDFRDNNKQV
jgi:hypothetical protein